MLRICKQIILIISSFFFLNTLCAANQFGSDIVVEDGLINLSVQGVPLDSILQELSSQTGISFEMKSDVERDITVKFANLPLVEGLRRILSPDSFVIEYDDGNGSGSEEIKKIIVYGNSSSPGRRIGALPKRSPTGRVAARRVPQRLPQRLPETEPEPEQSLESYGSLLKDPDPELREEAISDMVDDFGVASLPYLEKALVSDGNDDVRVAAAGLIGGLEEQRGIAVLAKGLNDLDEDVRMAVVEALGEIGGLATMPVLEKASSDNNEDVRDAAKYLIEELKE